MGQAIRESGLDRSEVYITSKYSNGKETARDSIEASLSKVRQSTTPPGRLSLTPFLDWHQVSQPVPHPPPEGRTGLYWSLEGAGEVQRRGLDAVRSPLRCGSSRPPLTFSPPIPKEHWGQQFWNRRVADPSEARERDPSRQSGVYESCHGVPPFVIGAHFLNTFGAIHRFASTRTTTRSSSLSWNTKPNTG